MTIRGRQRRTLDSVSGRLFRIIGPARPQSWAPPSLRKAKLDNLALVPGSLLPYKEQWQAVANELLEGEVLVVLPASDRPQRKTFEHIAELLRAKGHRVTTLPAERFS